MMKDSQAQVNFIYADLLISYRIDINFVLYSLMISPISPSDLPAKDSHLTLVKIAENSDNFLNLKASLDRTAKPTPPEIELPHFFNENNFSEGNKSSLLNQIKSDPWATKTLKADITSQINKLKVSSKDDNQSHLSVQSQQIIPNISHPESFAPKTALPKLTEITQNVEQPDIKTLKIPENFQVFPVGLDVDKRNVIGSLLVRGKEDGNQAIDFEKWLLPYDAVIQALKFKVTALPDGLLEFRAPGLVTRIDPKKLSQDPKLGLVFSIQELQTLFGVTAEFDIYEYSVRLQPPWSTIPTEQQEVTEATVQMEGLPEIPAPNLTLSGIEQRLYATGSSSTTSYQGELTAVGTALGGSWFVRASQPDWRNWGTWRIAEAQFLRQTNPADYILGSQAPFWLSQGTGDYWGFTTIQRQGFQPQEPLLGGTPNSRQRLQSAQIGRVITGTAQPGTLVRLTQGLGDRIIAEVLVDSSGVYRFPDIQVDNRFLASNYRLLLYPQGRLSEAPEIRNVTFSSVPGQLPAGASALIVSGGLRREFSGRQNSFLGEFSDFRGGVAQRWGLSEDLTVGVGAVYDESFRGLGEVFFQPKNIPLKVSVSALSGDRQNRWDVNADIIFDISPSARTRFVSDRFGSQFDFNWRMLPWLNLLAGFNNRDGAFGGLEIVRSGRNSFTFARATLDSENHFRWNFLQRLGQLELASRGNEVGSLSELIYRLSRNNGFNSGHALLLSYETGNFLKEQNSLATLSWRYRSPTRSIDGNHLWEAQLGYGIGSQGSGLMATLGTTIIPGMQLRGRYQGVSVTSNEPSFGIELVSSLDLQRGIKPDSSHRSDYFRTQGGILIQPFFDRNNNGKRDAGETSYLDKPELLLILNNRPLKSFLPEIQNEGALVRLSGGKYRLDLDPAGFPPDWQARTDAVAVDVVAGSYTSVQVPLIQSYTRTGVVTDTQGKPVAGVRVEAVQSESGIRRFSVTNGAGVYYLEGLPQGIYTLQINGKLAYPGDLKLEESSQAFKELNLQTSERVTQGLE
jgi:Carboxypeptidase regulatory-like domain